MDEVKKQRLAYLKERQRKILHEKMILREMTKLQENIPNFDKYYVFGNVEQIENVNAFLDRLPALTPTRPDFENLEKKEISYAELQNEKTKVFICFLHGTDALFDVLCMGELKQVCEDIVYWKNFCSDLILIWDNLIDFIYIDGDKIPVKSKL